MQIVAPAGSLSGLRASINGGADAVYLGMPRFGARAKAQNFDDAALAEAIAYAHLYGVKVFVTLNTLIKDGELDAALAAAKLAYDAGADAAIVQDIRFIELLKRNIPDFTLHASTQMGIHNRDGACVLKDLGINRAVLARETLPEDIAAIKDAGIEIEYFVQGALCIAFSGNCYFSSLASSYSGNRGKCMQLCRKKYLFHGERGYFLSAKDLCLYKRLRELEALGVNAIKIEGRMRSDEYAFTATNVFDSDMDHTQAIRMLKSVFNRGDYCEGYIADGAPFNVVYSKTQSNIGLPIGKISKVTGCSVVVNGFTPHKSDGFKILRNGFEICGGTERGGKIIADGTCRAGDMLCRTFDGDLSERVKNAKRKIPVTVDVVVSQTKLPEATLTANGKSVIVHGDRAPQPAESHAITQADIVRAFKKTSDHPFDPKINASLADDVFIPISDLNEFRRKAYTALRDELVREYKISRINSRYSGLTYNKFDGRGTILMVESAEQLSKAVLSAVDYIALNPRDYSRFDLPQTDKRVLLNLPVTMRGDDRGIIKAAIERDGIYGVISNNLYSLNLTDKPILLGIGHNIIGRTDLPHIRSVETDVTPKAERGVFAYAFGYAPLMTLCHCPYGKCINCSGKDELIDEGGRRFAMRRYRAAHCYWQLLNCVPHKLFGKYNTADMFLDCTTLSARETARVVLDGEFDGQYTVGNINKGLK